jgi:HSP20 family molecular chaperone IbpA
MSRENYDLFNLFDDIFANVFSEVPQNSRHTRLISVNAFPPANVSVNKDTKELSIEVALAGIKEDEIELSFDSDQLKLVVEHPVEKADNIAYIQRGLRKVDHIETGWVIDPRYYSRDNVEVNFKDGLLTIKLFPREEVAPKKIKLFGKLPAKEIADKAE